MSVCYYYNYNYNYMFYVFPYQSIIPILPITN